MQNAAQNSNQPQVITIEQMSQNPMYVNQQQPYGQPYVYGQPTYGGQIFPNTYNQGPPAPPIYQQPPQGQPYNNYGPSPIIIQQHWLQTLKFI